MFVGKGYPREPRTLVPHIIHNLVVTEEKYLVLDFLISSQNRISKNLAGFDKEATRFAQMFEIQKFRNTTLRRQLTQIIERSGPYATNDSELVQKVLLLSVKHHIQKII